MNDINFIYNALSTRDIILIADESMLQRKSLLQIISVFNFQRILLLFLCMTGILVCVSGCAVLTASQVKEVEECSTNV